MPRTVSGEADARRKPVIVPPAPIARGGEEVYVELEAIVGVVCGVLQIQEVARDRVLPTLRPTRRSPAREFEEPVRKAT